MAALGASGFVGSKVATPANQFKGFFGQGVGGSKFWAENQGDVLDFRWQSGACSAVEPEKQKDKRNRICGQNANARQYCGKNRRSKVCW